MKIQASGDCYITILNIDANDDIYVLFPNKYQPNNFLPANQIIHVPSDKERSLGIHFRMYTLPQHNSDEEFIMVIATRKPAPLLAEIGEGEEVFKKFKNDRLALTELARWLSTIPPDERAVDSQICYIREK